MDRTKLAEDLRWIAIFWVNLKNVAPPFFKFGVSLYAKYRFTQWENHSQSLCGVTFCQKPIQTSYRSAIFDVLRSLLEGPLINIVSLAASVHKLPKTKALVVGAFVYMSFHPSVCPSVARGPWPVARRPSVRLSVCLSVLLSACLCCCLAVLLYGSLSVCLSV